MASVETLVALMRRSAAAAIWLVRVGCSAPELPLPVLLLLACGPWAPPVPRRG